MASPKTKKPVTKKSVTKKSVTKKPATKKLVKSKKTALPKSELTEPELAAVPQTEVPKIEDPIGDETDGEAKLSDEQAAKILETKSALYQGTTSVVPHAQQNIGGALAPEGILEAYAGSEPESASELESQPRPPAKLERLQKILAAAGVASRRGAEAMIEQGRVQVNGKVVTVMGTKADAARDHIRVDGKLLQGPERHRYFVLNKPRGFVTTVKDPEGRPTVMQFFDKMKERLYPVGRLDYLSEGLLVVTNDGELANRLTKASSGVEKTYLVKVSGQPTEAELNILRSGVAIGRGKPGSPQVRTSPARIRQVRQGDNPWYEVVLIEGRNRELRKMFEEIGHFVEKIRRVGYGPLVLDQEPGSLRELQPQELAALRQAAEGTLRTPKSKDLRRRNLLDAGLLPTVLPKPTGRPAWKKEDHPAHPPERFAPAAGRPGEFRPKKFGIARPSEFRPKKFGADRDRTNRTDRTSRPARPADSFASGEANKLFRPTRPTGSFDKRAAKPFRPTRAAGEGFRPAAGRSFERPSARPAPSPAWKKDNRPSRPPARFTAGSTGESRLGPGRPFTAKPAWKKPERPARSTGEGFRPSSGRRFDHTPARPASRPAWKKDDRAARPDYKRPFPSRREARVFNDDLGPVRPPNLHIEEITGPTRPFTISTGKPRAGGARPKSNSSPGWKPKPRYGPGKPASGSHFKPKPGSFSKSGFKGKPGSSGTNRSGSRPFGNRPGGKKRG
jgi:23S rRNA pseudouridine2605 synthase